MKTSIFDKQSTAKPSAMRTVAERRYGDAEALRKTGENERANGVAYLSGFVIEILLKALLIEGHPSIARRKCGFWCGEAMILRTCFHACRSLRRP